MSRVICGFPGVGKTTLFNKLKEQGVKVLDSDSSTFDKNAFPANYIAHIKQSLADGYVVLVSTHSAVRAALAAEGIEYAVARPHFIDAKDEYMRRYKERGSPEGFLKLMEEKWEEFFKDVESDPTPYHYTLFDGQYLDVWTPRILEKKE